VVIHPNEAVVPAKIHMILTREQQDTSGISSSLGSVEKGYSRVLVQRKPVFTIVEGFAIYK
jgi:hypothetical protein